jgi:hypothetical protein
MQTFVNCWIGQAKRHGLRSELIVVEWNPPPDRLLLRDALSWPDLGLCTVRFVEVLPELHQRYRHAEVLPLYQMIAKNVGIRRAHAPFVLVTNIDILLSDELVSYLAEGRLQKNKMYRIDRLDIATDVPVDGSVDEQLRCCESHLTRCNVRNGTFSLTRDGQRALEKVDIASPGCKLSLGDGWFPAETDGAGGAYRWLDNDADITVVSASGSLEPLNFEVEPGPSAGNQPLTLQAIDKTGNMLAESVINRMATFSVQLRPGRDAAESFRLHVTGGGRPVPHNPRILNLRVRRCGWGKQNHGFPAAPPIPAQVIAKIPGGGLWFTLMQALNCLAQKGRLEIVVPDQSKLRRLIRAYVDAGGITGAITRKRKLSEQIRPASAPTRPITSTLVEPVSERVEDVARPAFLHTNACGDFTLLAREHWFDLRGYAEFDLFSMNLDSALCHSAHHAGFREEVLQSPLRIYHIEHGSGWTPEGQSQLFARLQARGIPWLDYQEFLVLAEQMRRFASPLIFNRENWGLADVELEETAPCTKSSVAAPLSQ